MRTTRLIVLRATLCLVSCFAACGSPSSPQAHWIGSWVAVRANGRSLPAQIGGGSPQFRLDSVSVLIPSTGISTYRERASSVANDGSVSTIACDLGLAVMTSGPAPTIFTVTREPVSPCSTAIAGQAIAFDVQADTLRFSMREVARVLVRAP